LFLSGRRSALAGLDDAQVQALSDGATTLLCVMNDGKTEARHLIPLPPDAGAGQEFYSQQEVRGGQTVECLLQAGETAAYVLRK